MSWEYLQVVINIAIESMATTLNAYGREGWELVSIMRSSSAHYEAFFKRRLGE